MSNNALLTAISKAVVWLPLQIRLTHLDYTEWKHASDANFHTMH